MTLGEANSPSLIYKSCCYTVYWIEECLPGYGSSFIISRCNIAYLLVLYKGCSYSENTNN